MVLIEYLCSMFQNSGAEQFGAKKLQLGLTTSSVWNDHMNSMRKGTEFQKQNSQIFLPLKAFKHTALSPPPLSLFLSSKLLDSFISFSCSLFVLANKSIDPSRVSMLYIHIFLQGCPSKPKSLLTQVPLKGVRPLWWSSVKNTLKMLV